MCCVPAVPSVFPIYVRSTHWSRAHYLVAKKLSCVPVQKGSTRVGAWVVLESVRSKGYGITIDANAIIRSSILLAGNRPAQTSRGDPVTNYRPSLHDLAVRFSAPYRTVKSRLIRATGSYRVQNSNRYACFQSVPVRTCV